MKSDTPQHPRGVLGESPVLHRRRRTGRHDARLSPGARRHRCRGAGEACGFLPRLPRRHRASLDAPGDGRARPDRRIPEAAASALAEDGRPVRRYARSHRRSQPPPHQVPLHRLHAAMGFPEFPARGRPALRLAQGDDEHGGRRSDPPRRDHRRRAGDDAGRASSTSKPISPSPATAGIRPCASVPASGRGDRRANGRAVVPRRPQGERDREPVRARRARQDDDHASTAATIGSAPMSSRRDNTTR